MSKLYIELFAEKHLGREQELNEDSVFCLAAGPSVRVSPEILAVLGVADGMGGPDGGVVASSIATEYLSNLFVKGGYESLAKLQGLPIIDHTALISEVFQNLNRKLRDRFGGSHGRRQTGTTLTVGLITYNAQDDKTYLHVGNVGNSRCYIIRGDQIFHATDDDSHAWQLYKKGEITYAEMLIHPLRHASTTIGMDETVSPQVHSIELLQNDIVLFSTDGLHDNVEDPEIEFVVNSSSGTREAVKALVTSAQTAGGNDDIAVALAYCSAEPIDADRGHGGGREAGGMTRRMKWWIGAGVTACVIAIAAVVFYTAVPMRLEQASVPAPPPEPEPVSTVVVMDTVRRVGPADNAQRSESAMTRQTVQVSVEWIAQTERFRIRAAGSSAVPVRLSYGTASYDVVPVRAIQNLYKTTRRSDAASLPENGAVSVTLKGADITRVTVGFTRIE